MQQTTWQKGAAAVTAAVSVALLGAAVVDRAVPPPSASVVRGSEEAFARGLHRREIPPGGRPQRWTGPRAAVLFRDVPAGAASLEVHVRGHRGAVAVAMDGVMLGLLPAGQPQASFPVELARRGRHEVELRTEGFRAGDGRWLGVQLQSVTLRHAPARLPSLRLLALFALPAAAAALGALAAGLAGWRAAAAAAAFTLVQSLLLWPQGLVRSPHAAALAAVLAAAALAAGAASRWCERRQAGSGRWAFAALCSAALVQGVLACSPLLVVSDAVFHANNLARVGGGEWLLTSVTQHARPFRFPYGVSFYAALLPLFHAGLDAVALVRVGAALVAVAASAALFAALRALASPARAGLAVVLLQLLPMTLDVHSHGNLSNVFGQALTTAFFAWWVSGGPGGWVAGAALLAAGALGHFSSLVVLLALSAALALREGRGAGRRRLVALAAGLAAALAYYALFAPLVVEQLPRLLEGGGQGRGASRGAWDALRLQVARLALEWGPPALVLAWYGRPRSGTGLDRALASYWLAGAALAALAVVSPVETRHLYALTVPLAVAAAAGVERGWSGGGWRRGLAAALLAAQAALAAANAAEALLSRYR